MNVPLIQTVGLSKRFGRRDVLNGVDLDIQPGSVVGLLGTNGAGKSTLIRCLLGLLRLSGGTARLMGEDPWTLSGAAKSRLGYVPQEVRLYPWMTVSQIVAYTAAFYSRWDDRLVQELIRRWELPPGDRVGPLSPGQIQKLGLILALGHRPEVLILDEPVSALDPVSRRDFLKSLLEFTQDQQHTVLFSTHITSDLERVVSHVAFLQDGRIALYEELDQLKDRVKRLRIVARDALPASFAIDGALRTEVQGTRALVTATHVTDPFLTQLEHRWSAQVTAEDLNLEEIFLELHQPVMHRVGESPCGDA